MELVYYQTTISKGRKSIVVCTMESPSILSGILWGNIKSKYVNK